MGLRKQVPNGLSPLGSGGRKDCAKLEEQDLQNTAGCGDSWGDRDLRNHVFVVKTESSLIWETQKKANISFSWKVVDWLTKRVSASAPCDIKQRSPNLLGWLPIQNTGNLPFFKETSRKCPSPTWGYYHPPYLGDRGSNSLWGEGKNHPMWEMRMKRSCCVGRDARGWEGASQHPLISGRSNPTVFTSKSQRTNLHPCWESWSKWNNMNRRKTGWLQWLFTSILLYLIVSL